MRFTWPNRLRRGSQDTNFRDLGLSGKAGRPLGRQIRKVGALWKRLVGHRQDGVALWLDSCGDHKHVHRASAGFRGDRIRSRPHGYFNAEPRRAVLW